MSSLTLEGKEQVLNSWENMSEQAALYALGVLDQPAACLFEDALLADAALAAELKAFDEVVACLALGVDEAVPPAGLREKLLARTATVEPAHAATQPVNANPPTLSVRMDEGEWQTVAPHVFCKALYADAQTGLVTSLIRLEPGGHLPRHRHLGIEQTLVVEGDCRVNGEVFYPGDFRMRLAGTEDSEVTTKHGTIILLIAPEKFEILDRRWPH